MDHPAEQEHVESAPVEPEPTDSETAESSVESESGELESAEPVHPGSYEIEVLTDWNDVPKFENLMDERIYWNSHQMDTLLLHHSMVRANSQEVANLTLKVDPRLLSRLKRLAKRRYSDLPSMIRLWLVDRLEREQGETAVTHPRGTEL